jgi:hypothetical protein
MFKVQVCTLPHFPLSTNKTTKEISILSLYGFTVETRISSLVIKCIRSYKQKRNILFQFQKNEVTNILILINGLMVLMVTVYYNKQ